MIFTPAKIAGAWLIDLDCKSDDRGFFARAWCEREFAEHGLIKPFVQTNLSHNHRAGTLRGMHFQSEPYPEAKLMRCIAGSIYDAIVDLRPDSPTYLQWTGVELSASNRRMFYVPDGCAHGYQALTDGAEVIYQVTACYTPGFEGGIRWNDPAFAIDWPVREPIVSAKDSSWPDFAPQQATLSIH